MKKKNHPSLYEINTRVWLRQFDKKGLLAQFHDIPSSYWDNLQAKGITYVWMMGIWQTVGRAQVLHYALSPDLHQDYQGALPDWQEEDVIGSPYAIDQYIPASHLGDWDDLAALRKQLHERGMLLILDFVPNHFHAETSLIDEHPYLFLSASETQLQEDRHTFYRHKGKIWAHGRDPYFPAWQDTIQVDYFDNRARDFMSDQLMKLAEVCDGVRCDMAMLMINTVFESTWRHTDGFEDRSTEFWDSTIGRVKAQHPNFQFIAEAYWDLEWQLQQLGFDYTYDKRLLDRLHEENVQAIRGHLWADPDFRSRSVRFLENHDEDRVLQRMDSRQAEAAAIITYTLPGMRFFHDGQWEGKRVRLPVQLGREPEEWPCTCVQSAYLPKVKGALAQPSCNCTYVFYEKLLTYLQKPIFQKGHWQQLEVLDGADYILAWRWTLKEKHVVFIINYAKETTQGKLSSLASKEETLTVTEPWRNISYKHSGTRPLDLSMYPFEYRILEFKT